ncbi:hypothetical protein LOCC1_G000985 [Lachnellula occidentalis]|uniref:Uncharacterized protein n=1 Tax=Lachnellula occidentalis TaxID=215460 RepID=A0A8H8S5U9_9HELO|nr:hypothetical protein LOCC1_G000985 [Lachnellula occidentalis]
MPRKLPWATSSSTTPVTKRPATAARSTPKRQKVEASTPQSDLDDAPPSSRKGKSSVDVITSSHVEAHAPSSSPPPEPPTERYMDEGIEKDDKFRMVEDEFLTAAQQFTVHLHTAEYKRQQKSVKAQKADEIKSISRPVTGKMPDQTKRKVESVNRSKTQRNAIENILNQKPGDPKDSDDSDDAIDLPYIGTTLHGLMDSPRKKAASLRNIGSIKTNTTTRAAAGFQRPSALLRSSQLSVTESPRASRGRKASQTGNESSTASSDEDDDDLDAPIPAPRLSALDSKQTSKDSLLSSFRSIIPTVKLGKDTASISKSGFSSMPNKMVAASSQGSFQEAKATLVSNTAKPRMSRVEFARQKSKQQELEQPEKKRDVIPMFS